MKKIFELLALAAAAALPVAASAQNAAPAAAASAGKTLYTSDGKRIGAIYRVLPDGSPQLILQGKLVTVPVASLTADGDKAVTSLTKAQLASAH